MKLNSIINLIVETPNLARGYNELKKYYKEKKLTKNEEILTHLIKNKFNENNLPSSDEE